MTRAFGSLAVACMLLLVRVSAADAPESRAGNAELPYSVIAALVQMRADVEVVSKGRLKLDVRVRSQDPGVKAEGVKLIIHSNRKGEIPLPLDDHGSIPATVVPDPGLLAETPPATVVANQPKGTMSLDFVKESRPLSTTETTHAYSYMDCAMGFLEFERCMSTLLGGKPPPVRTSFEAFSPEGRNGVPVLVRSGTQELARVVPDRSGRYAIPLQEAWMLPDVELVVPRQTQIGGGQWGVVMETLAQRYRDAFVKAGGKSLLPTEKKTEDGLMLPPVKEK